MEIKKEIRICSKRCRPLTMLTVGQGSQLLCPKKKIKEWDGCRVVEVVVGDEGGGGGGG